MNNRRVQDGERLRLELRFKNAALYNALRSKYPPTDRRQRCGDLKQAAKNAGVSYAVIIGYLSLYISPWNKTGEPTVSGEGLSMLLGISCEDLFPRRLYSGVFPKLLVREIDGSRYLTFSEAMQAWLLPSATTETPLDALLREEEKSALEQAFAEAIARLAPREQAIIKLRFGINTQEEPKLREISQNFALSPQRIQQIQNKILKRLRRCAHLRSFVDPGRAQAEACATKNKRSPHE